MGYFLSLSKADTNNWLNASEWALLFFGVVLTVGIVGDIKAWMFGAWKKRFEYIVLFGVMGELLADGAIFLFSSHLQSILDSEYSRLNKEAGIARNSAAKAEQRVAELNLELEKLKLPRHLTPDQSRRIVESLRAFPGTPYELGVFPDPESALFAEQIDNLLSGSDGAEWLRKELLPANVHPPPMSGTLIRGIFAPYQVVTGIHLYAGKGQYRAWNAIMESLQREGVGLGVSAWGGSTDQLSTEQQAPMRIVIGKKP